MTKGKSLFVSSPVSVVAFIVVVVSLLVTGIAVAYLTHFSSSFFKMKIGRKAKYG